MDDKQLDTMVASSDSVVKTLFAIMNEEDDIDVYYDKTPEEMTDIIKLVDARFPEKKEASYDPLYTKFGQVLLNGYNTFGIDFLRLLARRTDEVPRYCYKGLIDIYNNALIANEELAVLVRKFVLDLADEKVDDAIKFAKEIKAGLQEDLSDEEYINTQSEKPEDFI